MVLSWTRSTNKGMFPQKKKTLKKEIFTLQQWGEIEELEIIEIIKHTRLDGTDWTRSTNKSIFPLRRRPKRRSSHSNNGGRAADNSCGVDRTPSIKIRPLLTNNGLGRTSVEYRRSHYAPLEEDDQDTTVWIFTPVFV
ncbi:hypothetical protein JTE90_001946 [Oedothorax gibbosus]|uniref:Uncharacterized protein n=1 Tax=Oedothorax gibbosus TaxID=931172 RepID=A0AAV6VVI0_9ARAC|nr:hypothetical protein JTE90_001946 [Oedothorax gibbosus]